MKEFSHWNPLVPGALLAVMIYRTATRDFRLFPLVSILCITVVGVWFVMSIIRLFSSRLRILTAPSCKRVPLSVEQLEQCLGRERLDSLSLAKFGGVMITDSVFSGRKIANRMFREKPDPLLPFSGWVFLSTDEPVDISSEELSLELHDCLSILKVAPEVSSYLDMPPGTQLVRSGKDTFETDSDA